MKRFCLHQFATVEDSYGLFDYGMRWKLKFEKEIT